MRPLRIFLAPALLALFAAAPAAQEQESNEALAARLRQAANTETDKPSDALKDYSECFAQRARKPFDSLVLKLAGRERTSHEFAAFIAALPE